MKLGEFFQRFRDDHEIGRDIAEDRMEAYYDNGLEVGRLVHDRPSTREHGELLNDDNAVSARDWFRRRAQAERAKSSTQDR
jgi:hypothetical protein